ncbi:MAG: hypothetical protein P8Y70_16080 [Candidatus Lokiarchaeota archaeon]
MESSLIKFFAIVRKSGECYLSISFEKDLDETLIGGLITAIFSFGTTSLNQQLSKMSVESNNFSIESFSYDYNKDKSLIAVAMISKDLDKKEINLFSERVLKEFTNKYTSKLENFDGEVSCFEPFREELIDQIKEEFGSNKDNFQNKLDDIFNQITDGDLSGLDRL